MIGHLLGIFTFLLGMLLAVTLGYGYYHKNKYIQIYSICAIAWMGFIYFADMEIFGVVLYRLYFPELLNLICIILPLIPLWFIYHKRDRTEERIESARLSRQHGYRFKGDTELFEVFLNAGGKKCPKCGSTNFKIMRNYQIFECMAKECRWLYIDETNRMNQLLNPELQPLTEAQKRQIALEEERKKKEAEKLVKGFTDRELIDKYIDWDEFLENTAGFGLTEGAGVEEWTAINDELKYRNISSRAIEKRRSELHQIWRKKHYQGLPEERLIDDYIVWLVKIDVGEAKLEGAEFDSMCDEIKRRGITDNQIKKRRKELREFEEAYKKEKERQEHACMRKKDKPIDHELTWEEYKKKHYGKKQK